MPAALAKGIVILSSIGKSSLRFPISSMSDETMSVERDANDQIKTQIQFSRGGLGGIIQIQFLANLSVYGRCPK